MRLTTMTQTAKGLPATMGEEEVLPLRDEVLRQLERLKWFLWHGNVFGCLGTMEQKTGLRVGCGSEFVSKLLIFGF
jgi:hypothetical protein